MQLMVTCAELEHAYYALLARAVKAEAERDDAEAEADQLRAAYDDVRALNAEIAVGATNQALTANERAEKAEAALSEVVEALRVFADASMNAPAGAADDSFVSSHGLGLTLGHLRQARAAIAKAIRQGSGTESKTAAAGENGISRV